ncbi:glycosyltransferase family 39 protein [Microcoleus sp. FACHB-SPT15]|uniref:glycosyltransferase family 39 protein n=1 Tax=Microcoleus sp. FACHB-SPT15 TaxID=2692830 RepID=UPI0028C3F322|nr:glycosyltransferase family 39 protein [Microcoleus sp. FACHB-SPT15]
MKSFLSSRWFQLLLLFVWIAIGTGLRFTHLAGKPPWTDEFVTMVFSLGNSYQTVPLDQAISLDTLLQPLQPNPTAGASAVMHHIFTEDVHPPLYFVLAHWWMQLFPASGEYISLWVARSLPALLGVISIPAMYGLGWLAFRSRLVAQLAAAMMAVSPFGVFLAQEARHYALGILWVIASLCCLVVAVQHLKGRTPIPLWLVLCWVVVNSLGVATHYFFILTLTAEAIALTVLWVSDSRLAFKFKTKPEELPPIPNSLLTKAPVPIPNSQLWRIGAVAVGTLVGCLVWIPVWQMSHDPQMTQWIMSDGTFLSLLNPIFQSLAAWVTMLSLLPVEAPSLLVVIISGVVMIGFFLWAIPIFYRGTKALLGQPDTRLATGILGGFVLGAIALFYGITYFLGTDLTRGARYNFVYFPAVIVLVGAILSLNWATASTPNLKQSPDTETLLSQNAKLSSPSTPNFSYFRTRGKVAVAIIWIMGLLSGVTVVNNLGYQKYYRPDLLVPIFQKASSVPVLIATTHNTLVQTGEMMGIAWEFQRTDASKKSVLKPQFLLAHQDQEQCISLQGTDCRAFTTLQQTLNQLSRPLDLWLVNFKASVEQDLPNCFAEETTQYHSSVDGYQTQLFHCLSSDSDVSRQP